MSVDSGDKVFEVLPNGFTAETSGSGEDDARGCRKIYSDGKKLRVSESNLK